MPSHSHHHETNIRSAGARSCLRPAKVPRRACSRCYGSKVKCDLDRPACARCRRKDLLCVYTNSTLPSTLASEDSLNLAADSPGPKGQANEGSKGKTISLRWLSTFSHDSPSSHGVDTETDKLRSRAQPRLKQLSPGTIRFCNQYLRVLPYRLLQPKGTGLRFIHSSQRWPFPSGHLVETILLVQRIRDRDSSTETRLSEDIKWEMGRIMSTVCAPFSREERYMLMGYLQYMKDDHSTCLTAFQSYLILSLLTYFHPSTPIAQEMISIETLLNLQALSDRVDEMAPNLARLASPDTVLDMEYETWARDEAYRRTMFVACVFDNLWNANMGLPTVVAEDMGGLLAPSSGRLWSADEATWESQWTHHMGVWQRLNQSRDCARSQMGLRLEEIWGRSEESEDSTNGARMDQWVVEADAFGIWILAVCEMMGSRDP